MFNIVLGFFLVWIVFSFVLTLKEHNNYQSFINVFIASAFVSMVVITMIASFIGGVILIAVGLLNV